MVQESEIDSKGDERVPTTETKDARAVCNDCNARLVDLGPISEHLSNVAAVAPANEKTFGHAIVVRELQACVANSRCVDERCD